ncbi:hypothetical protein C0583_04805, partial [Candidatus Parcubacteria bacterium]
MKKAFPKLFVIAFLTLVFLLANSFLVTNAIDQHNATDEIVLPNGYVGGGVAQNWRSDDGQWAYTLPFDFTFYGETYRDIKVGSNGMICLDDADDCRSSTYNFESLSSRPMIAPLYLDLRTNVNSNNIYITENSDNVIIRWNATEYPYTDDIDFELVLYDNGSFKFNYGAQAVPLVAHTAKVGFSNGDAVNYFESSYNGNTDFNWVDSLAYGFTPMISSSIPANNGTGVNLDQNLTITFDRPMYRATGTISIKQTSDNSLIESFPATSSSITGWGT